jgi:hypothetical protein
MTSPPSGPMGIEGVPYMENSRGGRESRRRRV